MRLTGGRFRGRTLPGQVPSGVRPTSSRVREALFSLIGQDLQGLTVLDAFGGTGLLGFEAYSRGADVLIGELRRPLARQIQQSAQILGATLQVRCADAARLLQEGQWDIVLLDPPYAQDPSAWVERAAPAARKILVIEHSTVRPVPAQAGGLILDRQRRYGDTQLSLYRPAGWAGEE